MERISNEFMDKMLGEEFPVLGEGFVRVVDYMGDESSIVQAARVSYGLGTDTPEKDTGLIRYLMRHAHTTPFEMVEIKLHLKMPIFVARQWIRHRTASINEVSGRYTVLPSEFYLPELRHMSAQSSSNKQGRGDILETELAGQVRRLLGAQADAAFALYRSLSDEDGKYGLAKELSRIGLPLSTYTEFYWKIDLHNLLHFLKLRMDSHAQFEIREHANKIFYLVSHWLPNVVLAFDDYVLGAHTFSRTEMEIIRDSLAGKIPDRYAELPKREAREFLKALGMGD